MEFDEILKKMSEIDTNLAKRFEPLEKAMEATNDNTKTLTEQKEINEKLFADLKASLESQEENKKLVKAIKIHTPVDKTMDTWYKNLGHYILGNFGGNKKSLEYLDNIGIKALAEGITSTGGALVPDAFVPNLIELMATYGVFRRNAQVVPMGSDSTTWPKLNADVTVYSPGEAGSITASNPTFSNVKLVATKLASLVAISNELAEDAVLSIGQIVGRSIARAFAQAEDQAGFLGNATSTYWGFVGIAGAFTLNHANYGSTTASTAYGGLVGAAGNGYDEITIGNFRTLVGVLPTYAQKGAKFYCSKRFYYDVIAGLVQAAGGLLQAEYEKGLGQQFFGYPVEYVDVMPTSTANSQTCCVLGDLAMGAYLGDRRALSIDQDNSVYYASDQLAVRGTERIGINVFGWGSATVAGPICVLAMHAS